MSECKHKSSHLCKLHSLMSECKQHLSAFLSDAAHFRFLIQLHLFLKPKSFRQLRAELAAIWSPREDWRSLRRITKRAKRRALLYGELLEHELEPKNNPEDDEELSTEVRYCFQNHHSQCTILCTIFGPNNAVIDVASVFPFFPGFST